MISNIKTPGVYIEEKNAFPNSILQVPTDLPVFIGYTEKVLWNELNVKNKLILISSINEYQSIFGGYAKVSPSINEFQSSPETKESMKDFTLNGKDYSIELNGLFHLYNSLQLFFANGGSRCYILSIGTYESEGSNGPNIQHFETMSEQGVGNVFDFLKVQVEPTMILIPDALLFSNSDDYYNLMNSSLSHCGEVKSRISLMDVFHGNLIDDLSVFKSKQIVGEDPVSMLRAKINSQYVSYGAAYYPFVNSHIVSIDQINVSALIKVFTQKFKDEDKVTVKKIDKTLSILENELANALLENTPSLIDAAKEKAYTKMHTSILAISSNYKVLVQSVLKKINCLPVTPAVAGCISMVDNTRGVWKAPANISLSNVISPFLIINDAIQADMNVDAIAGKSVNVIRNFTNFGALIWGARTLDGNNMDWRYVNVRRTFIMIEQSIQLALQAFVFEPNDANTWLIIKSMIENFLFNIWKQGGLAGSKPEHAYHVSIGLGVTMTEQDIRDGLLNISVMVAMIRPAEFIVITLQQQLQES